MVSLRQVQQRSTDAAHIGTALEANDFLDDSVHIALSGAQLVDEAAALGLHLAAPGLAALLMGLVTRLLFLTLRSRGLADIPNLGVCLVFGGVFYLAALQAQGVSLRSIFFRK